MAAGGESTATGGTNVSAALHSSGLELLRITSERQWRSFTDSLASEGLIVEVAEQCQLQELWDRAVAGANAFGRRYGAAFITSIGRIMCHVQNNIWLQHAYLYNVHTILYVLLSTQKSQHIDRWTLLIGLGFHFSTQSFVQSAIIIIY